jgi:hypothetical protein
VLLLVMRRRRHCPHRATVLQAHIRHLTHEFLE